MTSRRSFLHAGLLAGVSLGVSGCTDLSSSPSLLRDLSDPSDTVPPNYHAVYACRRADVTPLSMTALIPRAGGGFLDVLAGESSLPSPDATTAMRGQTYRLAGFSGELAIAEPQGQSFVAEGSFSVDAFDTWLADSHDELAPYRGYSRRSFTNETPTMEGYGLSDDRIIYGTRSNQPVEPDSVLQTEIDAVEDDTEPLRAQAPSPLLVDLADQLTGGFRAAAQFELVAERPDTGVQAIDTVLASLRAVGLAAVPEPEETTLRRSLRYRPGTVPDADAITAALQQANADETLPAPITTDWSIETTETTATLSTTVSSEMLLETPKQLHMAFPAPGYEDLFTPVQPVDLGRGPMPRVILSARQTDAGEIQLTHDGGDRLTKQTVVEYTADGKSRAEAWPTPIAEGDQFTTTMAADPGTRLRVRWAVDTSDESIITTVRIPET